MTPAEDAHENAMEIIDAFASLHPAILLTWNEWQDLREMIERQWCGMSASDLVSDPLYTAHRRGG